MRPAPRLMPLLALLVSSPAFASDPDLCSPAPRTGCFQSGEVELLVHREPQRPRRDALIWSWRDGAAVALADLGDPASATDYAVCLYDGDATAQTELAAPAPGADSLLIGLDAPAGRAWHDVFGHGFLYGDLKRKPDGLAFGALVPAGGSALVTLSGVGEELGLAALDGIDPDAVISQVQASNGACFGANVSVEITNGPPFPATAEVIDPAGGEALLDELAALYNEKHGGPPLNMTLWISAVGAAEIQNQVVTTDPTALDTGALYGALHVAGWYGGMWFARDGFQSPAPPAPNVGALPGIEFVYRRGRDVALTGTDAEVASYLTNSVPVPNGFDQGTGLRSLISLYGYNTGYALTVTEDTAGGLVTPPPPTKLACEGSHPPLTSPVGPPANAPLLSCSYDPSFLDALADLRPERDAYVAAFAADAAALKAFQDTEEVRGRRVWTFFLGGVIKKDQAVREALWDVDNAFLEVIHAGALTNMKAQTDADLALGRRYAVSEAVLKGWLASYQLGLSAPEPRVLPRFDLGTTPVETF